MKFSLFIGMFSMSDFSDGETKIIEINYSDLYN